MRNENYHGSCKYQLIAKKLDKKLWAGASNTALYIINRTGTGSVKEKKPYKLWKNKTDIRNLKLTFGSEVWIYNPKETHRQLDAKREKIIFV